MDEQTATRLSELTQAFYREVSASFARSRQAPWAGWHQVLEHVEPALVGSCGAQAQVLDIACGNLRFERFLNDQGHNVHAWAIDSCDELVEASAAELIGGELTYLHCDLAQALRTAPSLRELKIPLCDLSVAFGFVHHLPRAQQREHLLKALSAHTRPGGFIVLAFWQFAGNAKLLDKAKRTTKAGAHELGIKGLGEGDYLLGWKDIPGAYRFCHNTTEKEIDELACAIEQEACEVARFSADGSSDDLNRYLILRRH